MTSKIFRDLRYSIFYGLMLNRQFRLERLGNPATGCAWTFHPDVLGPDSVVYSGGVGNDITFEHALVRRFGCRIVLFDPSPTGIATMAKPENQIPQFTFEPVGLSSGPGTLGLAAPINADEGSWYLQAAAAAQIRVPCCDLLTLLKKHGHSRVDLLKIDIEGSEFDVLEDVLARRIPIRQICVEYHHGMIPGIRRSQTIRSILALRRRGYRLLNQDGTNHTFLWAGAWPPRD
jgi:FkbM family methyltransferase